MDYRDRKKIVLLEERTVWRNLSKAAFLMADPDRTAELTVVGTLNELWTALKAGTYQGVIVPFNPVGITRRGLYEELSQIVPDAWIGYMLNGFAAGADEVKPILFLPFNGEQIREFIVSCPSPRCKV